MDFNRVIEQTPSGLFVFKGFWKVVHRDKFGNVVDEFFFKNLLTAEGINYVLNAGIHGDTQISSWYFAPYTDNSFTPLDTDTYAAPRFTEATTQIQESLRQEWDEGAASGKTMTNAVAAVITAAAGGVSLYGAGVVGGGSTPTTKGDVLGGGVLLSSGNFGAVKTLAQDETLSMTYTLSGASA